MTIQSDLMPTQCKLIRICLQFDNGILVRSDAEVDIFNASNDKLLRYTMNIPWTASEQMAIEGNIMAKYSTFKLANNFTELEEDI